MLFILVSIVIGLIFGAIFKFMLPRYFSNAVITLVVSLIGATIGGFGAMMLKTGLSGSAFLSAIGAIVFLVIDGALGTRNNGDNDDDIPETSQFNLPQPPALPTRELMVKTCPACRRTYTDISLNFCLDDGATLSGVMKIQTHGDPEDTVSFSNRR